MRFPFAKITTCFLVFLFLVPFHAGAVGQSAVITLVFPPGARATGLGEAFTAIADDANATFFNPAGLGQDPLANAWKAYAAQNGSVLTAIASKRKKDFGSNDKIWAGTNHGVLRFNGKAWESYDRHLIAQGENLTIIAHKYLNVDNDETIRNAVMRLKKANNIETARMTALTGYLQKEVSDSVLAAKKTSRAEIMNDLISLAKFDRNAATVYGKIASRVDSLKASKMADDIAAILLKKDQEFEQLVELKIPFTIAVDDSVTALMVDSLERVWVGSAHGLWRYDGMVWTPFTVLEGLPSNFITCIAVNHKGDIAVGTNAGIGINTEGKWTSIGKENGLPDSIVNALAFDKNNRLFVGTSHGLAMMRQDSLSQTTRFDSSNGLLSNNVKALFIDSHDRLWVGGDNGVAIYDETTWKRYKFPNSTVSSITELTGFYGSGTIWIGTNKGAIAYTQTRMKTDAFGIPHYTPEWKVYHSKNALKGDDVHGISVQGRDIWLATTEAVNEYKYAERQILLFYEQLLPAFKIPDLWHFYLAGVIPTEDWGTIGLTVNFINFGTNDLTNEQGVITGRARSWEGVFGLSYGILLAHDFSGGLNIKYAHSALAPGVGPGDEGVGRTFAVDAAILKRNLFVKNFDLGLNLQNMGPSIFYISQDQQDPIPFTVKLGLAYRAIQTSFHDLKLVLDLNREIVKNYPDKPPDPFYKAIYTGLFDDTTETTLQKFEEINVCSGIEYWYANFLAIRIGNLFDKAGQRYELTLGIGIKYGNMNFDWSFIHSPEGFMKGIVAEGSSGARDGQWRASFLFKF
jgi:ligand-binding sensor domain-containing protein